MNFLSKQSVQSLQAQMVYLHSELKKAQEQKSAIEASELNERHNSEYLKSQISESKLIVDKLGEELEKAKNEIRSYQVKIADESTLQKGNGLNYVILTPRNWN